MPRRRQRRSPVTIQDVGIHTNVRAELRRLTELRSLAVAKFETYLRKAKTTFADYKIDGAASPSAINRVKRAHADLCSAFKPVAYNIAEARNLTADYPSFAEELADVIASEKDLNTQLEEYTNEYEAVTAAIAEAKAATAEARAIAEAEAAAATEAEAHAQAAQAA